MDVHSVGFLENWGFGDFQCLKSNPNEPQQPIETSQLGTTLPLVAVSTGALLAPAQNLSASVLPLAICIAAVLTAIVAWTGVRWHGDIARYAEP